ncbi:uncharacterized protein LOC116141998 [Pistacia vera]|uniref:uncharacterized protein LOC116141998 n=1 Tax=Pistacia vera TaxID=55513 RepID=UPI001263C434|nr:uncharacterized protein LOC116141998 [Pistacia vera]
MKQHLAGIKGDVGACLKVHFDVQYLMRESLKDIGIKNKEKADSSKYNTPYGAAVHRFEGDMLNEDSEEFRPSEIHINESRFGSQKQSTMLDKSKRKKPIGLGDYFAPRTIPFVDAIAAIGPGYKHPNYHGLRVNLLRDAKKEDVGTLLKMFEEIALWIRPNSIVHFVLDNGSNYKTVGRMLSEKFPSITWSPCATHSINLVLKDIVEMDHIVYLARRVSEGWKKIIRPDATGFATTFIAMRSLHEHKHDLQAMVTDKSFVDSRYAKSNKGKQTIDIILDNDFWNDMGKISKVVSPLMRLLRIVDSDEKLAIGYVYDGMRCYKRISFDPIDYESIDKTESWIVDDEEEVNELNYEELEQMLYGEGSIPAGVADHPSFYDSTDGSEDPSRSPFSPSSDFKFIDHSVKICLRNFATLHQNFAL